MFVRVSLVVEAVNHLKVRSYLLDGEVVRCDEKGVTSFQLLRQLPSAVAGAALIRPICPSSEILGQEVA
jgi:hypothetical protein